MELDELKQQLNKTITPAQQQHSAADISALLKRDSLSVVQKIKRSLWIELAFAIVFILGCVAALIFSTQWVYRTYFFIFIFVSAAFTFIFSLLLKKTYKLSSSDSIRSNLHSLISVLKEYVKRYLQLGMALLPICFGFAYWLSYHDPTRVAKPFRWDVFGFLIGFLLIFGTAVYYFSKWYLKKLYGNYISQLEALLMEFEEA